VLDLMVLIWVTILMFVLLFINRKFHIEKIEWGVLILAYIGYITYLLIH
jgi:Ca2+/Na+ antiporter